MEIAVVDFAKKHEVPTYMANGFLNFLVKKGLAEKKQQKKENEDGESKRGRPSVVFEIGDEVTISL